MDQRVVARRRRCHDGELREEAPRLRYSRLHYGSVSLPQKYQTLHFRWEIFSQVEDIFSQVEEIFSQVGEKFLPPGRRWKKFSPRWKTFSPRWEKFSPRWEKFSPRWEKFSPTWERNCETRLAWMTSLQERLCFFRREQRAVPSPKGLCHQRINDHYHGKPGRSRGTEKSPLSNL